MPGHPTNNDMDPMQKLFGRPVFSGSGRVGDYIPEAPDLSYLGGRPEFIPDDANHDPGLDFENLVRSGLPMGEAMRIQEMRARAHQAAAAEKVRRDSQGAMKELEGVDYTSPKVANQLLSIFSKFPNARKSKEVVESMNFMRGLKPQEEAIDLEGIADPILRGKAEAEGWHKLPKAQATRLMGAFEHNRNILAKAFEANLTEEDLKDTMDASGVYDPIKAAAKIKAGRYDLSQESDPEIAQIAIAEGWDKLSKPEAARRRHVAQLNREMENMAESVGVPSEELASFKDPKTGLYDSGKVKGRLRGLDKNTSDTTKNKIADFTRDAQAEREALLSTPTKLAFLREKYGDPERTEWPQKMWEEAHNELAKQKTPSEKAIESLSPASAKTKSQSTEAKASDAFQVIDDTTVIVNGKRRQGTKEQIDRVKKQATELGLL